MYSEYKEYIEIKTKTSGKMVGKIEVDFDSVEKYKDLDELIDIEPQELSEEEKQKLLDLIEICPNLNIVDFKFGKHISNGKEYLKGEEWIDSVLEKIDPNWSDVQKIAYIENEIGKKFSYAPEHGTDVGNNNDEKAIWRVISSGYGVCSGIAGITKYMLNRIGINADLVRSNNHVFIRLEDIEIPKKDGTVERGNTFLDPTWDLGFHRFGLKPAYFFIDYERIRELDVKDGKDSESHKIVGDVGENIISLEDDCLRDVFKSIGVADRNGDFPMKDIFESFNTPENKKLPIKEKLEKCLSVLSENFPEFAESVQESILALEFFLNSEIIDYGQYKIGIVYEREDKEKKANMFFYADLEEEGELFYYADKESKSFLQLTRQEFEEKFECYEKDLEENNGIRMWDKKKEKSNSQKIEEDNKEVEI